MWMSLKMRRSASATLNNIIDIHSEACFSTPEHLISQLQACNGCPITQINRDPHKFLPFPHADANGCKIMMNMHFCNSEY